ncbi:GAF and ANTAR domain-containing protein [Herbiconiux daphne]|uniref:GAF and ANTAR domain-containing protein n=1 Tax=Herbiconiux daphne TaxID=2970914 RepID=A0ABT2H6E1_9MICO|nr:GAF and ANTAR domain-containing protein [Herbiconiux daphne]MCS5735458.1 GAF and ANTAR domain-containing protein [Herbiconiux daphne]
MGDGSGDGTRESQLVHTLVRLADTLVDTYDVVEVLQTLVENCVSLVDAQAGGIILSDQGRPLEVIASTSEETRLVELIQLSAGGGPCVDCITSGVVVSVPDIATLPDRWPLFRERAEQGGFAAVHAVPLRSRGTILGSLNVFWSAPLRLDPESAAVVQGLADVATISILQERSLRESELAREQLQHALQSRIVIEQAKGVVAFQLDVGVEEAFTLLRDHARSHGERLSDVAARVVARELDV